MSVDQITKRGGSRSGSGRDKGSSVYGETTKPIRVPESLIPTIQAILDRKKLRFEDMAGDCLVFFPKSDVNPVSLPLFSGKVSAGFPSPADDFIEKSLDLNEYMVENPSATFYACVQGESMKEVGIIPNALLVVDRSREPKNGEIVVCALNGYMAVKRLVREGDHWELKAENSDYPGIILHEELDLVIWGVVTGFFFKF